VEIDVLRPKELSPALAARWLELQRLGAGLDSPFLSPCWARCVEQARGDDDVRVAVLNEGGAAVGFVPASVGKTTAIAAGGAMCDYEGVVAAPGVVVDPQQLVRALGVGRYDFSHVLKQDAAFAPYVRGEALSWIVDVPNGYEAYAAERRAAGVTALKDLDKKRRKVGREVAEPVFTAWSGCQADFERLFELKREQFRLTGQTDIFAADWTLRLVRDVFALGKAPDMFGGALFTLHLGDKLAAVQFHLMGEKVVHAWMIAHEPEFDRYSPGLLLFQDILRWMDDQPYQRLDFGYGDYRFKRELSNRQATLTHGFVGLPSAATLVREAAYGLRHAAESLPLGPVSALPGKAMRRLDLLRGLR
jgi:CelD/BcsL family acetyltransferase involved in cellulose biosynthesis